MDNLVKHQETIDFPMKIMGVSSNFSLKPVHWDIDWIIYIGIINGLPYGIMNRRFMGSILPIFLFDQQKSSVDQPTFGGDTSMCKLSASTTGWWCNNCWKIWYRQWEGWHPQHMKWKIPRMFETTNQTISTYNYTSPDLLWIFTTLWSG